MFNSKILSFKNRYYRLYEYNFSYSDLFFKCAMKKYGTYFAFVRGSSTSLRNINPDWSHNSKSSSPPGEFTSSRAFSDTVCNRIHISCIQHCYIIWERFGNSYCNTKRKFTLLSLIAIFKSLRLIT